MHFGKTRWILISVIIAIIAFAILGFSTLFLKQIPNYVYYPTRYVFITDKDSNNMAVVDLNTNSQVSTIELDTTPDLFTIDTINPIMAYADSSEKKVYFYDMRQQKNASLALEELPIALFFIPDRQAVVVVMKDKIALANYDKSIIYTLADIPENIDASAIDAAAFSAIDASLWFKDKHNSDLYRIKVGRSHPKWERIDTKVDNGTIGVVSSNPQGDIVAYSAVDNKQAMAFYQKEKNEVLGISDSTISALPFINANNRTLVYGRQDGSINIYDLLNPSANHADRKVADSPITKVLGGWLNQVSVVLAEDSFSVINNFPYFVKAKFDLPNKANDMWVTGDGKTALVTYPGDQQEMMLFDLQTGTQQKPVVLKNIKEANFIKMSGNNSFCY